MYIEELRIQGVTAFNNVLRIGLPTGNYDLPFEYQEEVISQETLVLHEKVLLEELYILYYSLLQEVENVCVSYDNQYLTMLLPGESWADQFRNWYDNQINIMPSTDLNQKKQGLHKTLNITHFHCTIKDDIWQMLIESNQYSSTLHFKIDNLRTIHWCVIITQAFRAKNSLTVSIDEAHNKVLDIQKTEE